MKFGLIKRVIAGALTGALLMVTVAGCGESDGVKANSNVLARSFDPAELVYNAQGTEINFPVDGREYHTYNSVIKNNILYCIGSISTATGYRDSAICGVDLITNTEIGIWDVEKDAKSLGALETTNAKMDDPNYQSGINITNFAVGVDGSVRALFAYFHGIVSEDTDYTYDYYILTYDNNKRPVSVIDINEYIDNEKYFYSCGYYLTAGGDSIIVQDDSISIYDSEMRLTGEIDFDYEWINSSLFTDKERLFINYYTKSYEQELCEIDLKNMSVKQLLTGLPFVVNQMTACGDNIIINGYDKVYYYDIEAQSSTELFDWFGLDIKCEYIEYIYANSLENIIAFSNDYNTGNTYAYYVSQINKNELKEKTELVIGALYRNSEIETAVVDFNNMQDEYHVTIKEYIDWESSIEYEEAIANFNNDIIGDDCPDLIDLTDVNLGDYYTLNVFEDLTPYFEGTSISFEDYFPNMTDAYKYEGKVFALPVSFSVSTMVGNKDIVGDRSGWTFEEFVNISIMNPEAMMCMYPIRDMMYNYLIRNSIEDFIDWETGSCSFDSDTFKMLLEYVGTYPEELSDDFFNRYNNFAQLITDNQIIVYDDSFYDLNEMGFANSMYNNNGAFIGYPSIDGKPKTMLECTGALAMSSKCKNKDAAAKFLEYYYAREKSNDLFGLPANKKELQKKIDEELAHSGEKNGTGVGLGDWSYEAHYATQEEIDILMEAIDNCKVLSSREILISNIILEEAALYFSGQKSLDEVTNRIQRRVSDFVAEHR